MGDNIVPQKEEVAKKLADAHFSIEPSLTHIFKIVEKPEAEALESTPIKLLEVNAATSPSGVMPLYFGPAPDSGISYPSVIVEVTPAEYEQIQANELRLPEGWFIGEEIFKGAD